MFQSPAEHLRREYDEQQKLFQSQPSMVQHFFEMQARSLADAVMQKSPQARFNLPISVVGAAGETLQVPAESREQIIGGFLDRLTRGEIGLSLRQRLAELEGAADQGVAVSAMLTRYATAIHLVRVMLPSGRSVTYAAAQGEEIPTLPSGDELDPESAITAATDAIAEEGGAEEGRGELLVPYVPYARKFYLPKWIAFDKEDRLLVGAVNEAEAFIASMQRFVNVLHAAVSLAPYMVADEDYQRKRYGMLGQLINQGRALARYQTQEIITTIKRRAASNDLNRGLSLSLPYFDDQTLEMKTHDFQVIPAGRIMFVPAFVARASREEQAKVAQDTRFNASTRQHLLVELLILEKAFESK
jgi:hypothetical protein